MNKIVISIEVPEGVVPDVQYVTSEEPPIESVYAHQQDLRENFPSQPEFPPFPVSAASPPQCSKHHRAMKPGKGGGWFCSSKDESTSNGWCAQRIAA